MLLPEAGRLLLGLGLAGTVALLVAGVLVLRSDDYRPSWGAGLLAGLVGLVVLLVAANARLHSQTWVGFDDGGRLAVLEGAGPDGLLGVDNVSRAEPSTTTREQLPALLAGALDEGMRVGDRAVGQELVRCLAQLFTPPANAEAGVQDDSDLCRDELFTEPPVLPVPEHPTMGTTEHAPAVAASDDQLVVAWTDGNNRRLQVSSSANGTDFDEVRTLPAARSTHEPALASDGDRFYLAWRGADGQLAVASSSNGTQFSEPEVLEWTESLTAPALAYGDGRLLLAWVGVANQLHLASSEDLESLQFPPEQDQPLRETSGFAPSLLFADEHWYLSWTGTDDRLNVQTYPSDLTAPDKDMRPELSEGRPAMAVLDVCMLAWRRPDTSVGLLVSRSREPDFVAQLVLGVDSGAGVSMATFRERAVLAWAGGSLQPDVHVLVVP